MIFYRKINWVVEFRRMKGTTPFSNDGVYVSGNLGVAIPMNSDVTFGGQSIGNIKSNSGFSASGAVGYEFNTIRLEAEVNYQQNALKSISNGSNTTPCSTFKFRPILQTAKVRDPLIYLKILQQYDLIVYG